MPGGGVPNGGGGPPFGVGGGCQPGGGGGGLASATPVSSSNMPASNRGKTRLRRINGSARAVLGAIYPKRELP